MRKIWKAIVLSAIVCSMSLTALAPVAPVMQVAAASTQNMISGELSDGFSWSLDTSSQVLTVEGNGTLKVDANCGWIQYDAHINTVVLGDGITDIDSYFLNLDIDTLVLGSGFNAYDGAKGTPNSKFEVSSQNPFFSTHDGALYSKDGKTLIRVPAARSQVTLKPGTEVIADYSFWCSKADYVILPEGVKTVAPGAFCLMEGDGIIPVVVPDSIQSIGLDYTVSSDRNVVFLFSSKNRVAGAAFSYMYGAYDFVKGWEKLHYRTVEEIYQGVTSTTYGWKSVCGNLFFVTKDGCAETGWIYDQGKYYFYERSNMEIWTSKTFESSYQTKDGYYKAAFTVDETGAMVGTPPSGMMAVTTESVKPISISGSESAKSGFVTEKGNTYYYKDGAKLTGLQYIDGKTYYFGENGVMQKSKWVKADGTWYFLNDYGAGVVNCWRLNGGKYFYLGADGKMKTNSWIKDYGSRYYVKADGSRYESSWAKINGAWYWFGGSGKMAESQWLKLADGKWYYFTGSGAMAANRWVKSGAYWYYLGKDGAMLTSTVTPDGYRVDSQGRWR